MRNNDGNSKLDCTLQEDTPLAGSSAGALVCVVAGGGLSMHDALQATKELALDCRTYGTAFRLGVSIWIVWYNNFGLLFWQFGQFDQLWCYHWDTAQLVLSMLLRDDFGVVTSFKLWIIVKLLMPCLQAVLRIFLEKFLPNDIHETVNGKVRGSWFILLCVINFSWTIMHNCLCFYTDELFWMSLGGILKSEVKVLRLNYVIVQLR